MPRTGAHANETPLILRGSLIILKRKCGKPGCRCARGELHMAPALSYSVAGVTKMLMLREADLPLVTAALARYKRAQADLERQALRGVAVLRQRLAREKAAAGTRRR